MPLGHTTGSRLGEPWRSQTALSQPRLLPRQPQFRRHDAHNGRPRGVPALGPVLLELPKHGQDADRIQPEGKSIPGTCVAKTCRIQIAKKLPGSCGVPSHSFWLAFADLHTSGGQIDETLDEPGFGRGSAQGVPEPFPGFMRFPVVPGIEESESVEPLGAFGENCGNSLATGGWISREPGARFGRQWRLRRMLVEMPPGVGHGMRMLVTRDVAVGRKGPVRSGSVRRSGA